MQRYAIAVLSILFLANPFVVQGRFFKKVRKSLTKALKETVVETIPLTQAIEDTKRKKREVDLAYKALLDEAEALLEGALQTLDNETKTYVDIQDEYDELSKKLLTGLLQEGLGAAEKEKLRKALERVQKFKGDKDCEKKD